jgi:uncharacterized coiled-coil protein SlyX
MPIDTALIKAENLLATGPTPSNTVIPSKVTQLEGQNIWEYEWTNTWPQTGIWTVTLNADGFSIPKGTVLHTLSVMQGTFHLSVINWETTESVATLSSNLTTLSGKVAALEAGRATNAALATLQSTVNALQMSVNTQNNQIAALTQRVETLEVDVVIHTH